MVERFDHLELPFYPESYEREKRKAIIRLTPRTDEKKKEFFEIQVQRFDNIKDSFTRDKSRYREYLDPSLIFKLDITQSIDEETLRRDLGRMGIAVLSPSPDKKGLWVVFAEDENIKAFKEKFQLYVEGEKYNFFNAIGEISEIPVEEKIGEGLKKEVLETDEIAYLDVEIWRMEDEKLERFIEGLKRLIESKGGKITDKLVKESFCLLRVRANKELVETILPLREVALIDRPPKPYIEYRLLSVPLEELNIKGSPPENATAIAVLDSGILSKQPLLEKAVGDEIAAATIYSGKIKEDQPQDDVGHGTKVAGIALYGDIKQCIENKEFNPEVWILSAKVMYGERNPITGEMEPKYDEEELLEHQIERAVRRFSENYSNFKVVNLSLGNTAKRMFGNKRQFNMASLIDELAKELKLVFIISAGNFNDYGSKGFPEHYPNYLLEETEDLKIIDPGTAALGITVGSITQEYGPLNRNQQYVLFSPASTNYPSPFTRVGPGYKGMIKPELVEEGGNIIEDSHGMLDIAGKLVTLNPNWLQDGRLFTVDYGTSFSAPKVANYVARLFNKYPHYSHNLIKSLLISSAQIPGDKPDPLSRIRFDSSDSQLINLLKIYGYGKPHFDRAISSTSQQVLLLRDNSIKPNSVHIYYFYLPNEFISISGTKKLSVTLVYDPPVNKNRVDYMGCSMEFHLFKDMEIDQIVRAYKPIKIDISDDEVVPETLKVKEIKLHPGVNLRKKGVHQRGIVEFKRHPHIKADKPLVLVTVCQDRWMKDDEYHQDYAVIVTVEHSANIDLFNKIRVRNQERVRVILGEHKIS